MVTEFEENKEQKETLNADQEIMRRKIVKMKREIGSSVLELLENPEIIEIMANPNGEVWIDSLTEGMKFSGINLSPDRALAFLETVADYLNEEFAPDKPILEGELPLDGSRLEGHRPPITNAAAFTIRKKASKVFPFDDYVKQGRMTQQQADFIENAIKERKNILVAGATGSGKTTFANAMLKKLHEISESDRVVFIEDTIELQCYQKNQYAMRTNRKSNVTMTDLVKCSMRLRPDRIIIGEVRDGAALDLLKSWNTGHPGGITTVHANSAKDALGRLEMLILEATDHPMKRLISEAVNIVIFMEKTAIGPKLTEIAKVEGYDVKKQDYVMDFILSKEENSDTAGERQQQKTNIPASMQWAAPGVKQVIAGELEKIK